MRTMMLPMILLLVPALCPVALQAQDRAAGPAATGLVVRAGTASAGAALLESGITRVGSGCPSPAWG